MTIVVAAVSEGVEVGRWLLGHGEDPAWLLAAHGWGGAPTGTRLMGPDVVIDYEVTACPPITAPEVPLAPQGARRLQRLAAYVLVVDAGHLLLTQLSERVAGGAGHWTLPGGGVDPGEAPVDGAVREVHEEAGQVVVVDELVQVQSRHWIGDVAAAESPEDFHAVRLIHRATCPEPGPAWVVEVDGSTEAAAWVPLAEVGALPVVDMVRLAWPHVPGAVSYPL